jgi:hypothetical protein
MIHKIIKVETKGFELICTYGKGEIVHFDMSDIPTRKGTMVQALKDPSFFSKVFLESGAPTWPNGYDLCPEMIFREGKHINSPLAAHG